jgi:hypothetical protein
MDLEKATKLMGRLVWIVAGLLAVIILSLAVHGVIAIQHDIREVTSQLTIEDVRQALTIFEKQIDKNMFVEMTYRGYITDKLLEWTPENWKAFLDFAHNNGYLITDDNWQDYIHGKLKP